MTARRLFLRMSLSLGGAVLGAHVAQSQAIEEHPAPILHGPALTQLEAGALLRGSTDATPFGVNLSGLMVVDAHEGAAAQTKNGAPTKTGTGIDLTRAGPVASGLQAALAPFVGQPLSYKAIAAIEAAITRHYRENGRALVLVSVPPQEITAGVLQVNVNTFRLEAPPRLVGDATDAAHVTAQIRLTPGQEVDTARLMEDVAWLNLNPFRQVAVAFEPGQAADGTLLTLQVQSRRPWSAYAGISNAGSQETGMARLMAGFNVSALPWQDQQLSYQINISPESRGLWDTFGQKGYISHGLTYFAPITLGNGLRFKATAGLTHVSSFAVSGDFATGTTTDGQSFELAFPLPRRTGAWVLVPELYLGLEHNAFASRKLFGGLDYAQEAAELSHVELGFRSSLNGRLFGRPTQGDVDVSVVAGHQDGADDYRFVKFKITQDIGLQGGQQIALRLSGQKAQGPLHPIDQLGLGGASTVRGYAANAVSAASATSLSVEYRLRPLDFPLAGQAAKLRPHAFLDLGHAAATDVTPAADLASVGIGGTVSIGESWETSFTLADALKAAGEVKSGDISVALRLIARF
ncbi:hypothetical protein NX862_16045 [Rhodobacter sp. KR11]|uniref:ShlB/FhaC/HecB family hemolysin secretion/activation protein n=1 Tax=Rhodobacter sp. KR11 TaxID=2974588 RepID=UPI002221A454|nr:ShlB/FhaC/HecB family hemolysin secretion/activation protein [Rhodobacter sp. KR11]MCW1920272.1 hypothetical protein [Rhodobacter sp. KR11]